ncbi:MAG: ankyrin repeat domain-containing protein [Akkermansia sp.]|nr:ankyrin repeat domain-containing protein [Akkermansia sp.]
MPRDTFRIQELFIHAVERGQEERVRQYLLQGARINHRSPDTGETALHLIMGMEPWHAGHDGVVNTLLEAGADANVTDNDGRTPLLNAAWNGRTQAIRLLLSYGAKETLNVCDATEHITPLHAAVIACRDFGAPASTEAISLLLAAGADVNIPDCDGWTPLHSCACYNLLAPAQMLLAAGENPHIQDKQGLRPDELARQYHHDTLADYLQREMRRG